ncbi:5' DNA nuclease [Rhizobium sp. 'Codium 1']|uniref:5' DNA nuclease n=1 Tax=Rhizobium sp. 'Codium 1' TaxID=2940484 RepID=UPI001E3CB1ED|nr:5' DNA nuclease [Rhizobium sp. 'Codium 1']MCC8933859.1 5' DNA nuclease [Rhizobium sp. 'Codium 1']
MTSSSDKGGKKGPDDKASDARAPEGLDDFISNPAAAMAAATAFGMGMAAQMGRLFLGTLQGAMDVTGQLARQLEEERKVAEADKAAAPEGKTEAPAGVARTEPPAAKANAKAQAAKPIAPKAKAKAPVNAVVAKAVVAKAEKPKPAPKEKAAAKPKARAVPGATVATKGKAAPKAKALQKADVKPKVEARVESAAAAPKPKKATKTIAGKADDLKKIDGIGPKVEQVLKGRGISRFQDLASMDEAALSVLDKDLGLDGRVLRDDWAGQARRLAGGKARSGK